MLILLLLVIMITFVYAEQGEKYKTFNKTKKIISYTVFTIGVVIDGYFIITEKVSATENIKAALSAAVITAMIAFVAIATQNDIHKSKEKE